MRSLYPEYKVARLLTKANCVVVYSYGWRWLALFPHHGPGRQHERQIELKEWQRGRIRGSPFEFIRGLVDSDGCRSIRREDGKEYPFYSFDNRSHDIIGFCCWACDLIGLPYTQSKQRSRSRDDNDVARLDEALARKC